MTEIKKLIDDAPEHIRNMSKSETSAEMKEIIKDAVGAELSMRMFTSIDICHYFKISIDWVGNECVCYPFQNVHGDVLGEDWTLRSVRDKNPRIAIAKAVIWQQEVLNG